jgi:protein-disulfide isomerase
MEDNKLFVPGAIVVAGLIVAGAIFFTGNTGDTTVPNAPGATNKQEVAKVEPINNKDHIIGDINAEIVVIEYSDYECPFCGRFHPTMERIMSEYGDAKKVAWVFRHFPLDKIHQDARPAAEASECVAELNGNEAFWAYSKKLFEGQPISLSTENLKSNAEAVGVNGNDFTACVDSGRHKATVEAQYQSGLKLAQSDPSFGTPYSVVLAKDGRQVVIAGAQPYEKVKQAIDSLLTK